ncbi:Origin recognition complex subunit 6-like protein [Elsinoe fawcettii]|nr:Origin recognition complex subunit 6-like protein [Elsinoe fawcettii]
MPSAVEQALITLVPSVNNLPKELTSLANALLMQSRSKAARLKQDEEIARTYVCSHIACERLKPRLGLEIQPRPPVPPRVYKKLKTFFEKQLDVPTTPSTNRHIDAVSRSGAASSQRDTPTSAKTATTPGSRKRLRDTQDDTPSKTPAGVTLPDIDLDDADTPSRRSEKRARPPSAKDLTTLPPSATRPSRRSNNLFTAPSPAPPAIPEFVDDLISRLTTRLSSSSAARHVRAGLDHVIALRGFSTEETSEAPTSESKPRRARSKTPATERDDAVTPSRLPALLIILTLVVVGREKGWHFDDQEGYLAKQESGIEAVREIEAGWLPEEDALGADLEAFLKAAGEEGWMDADWFLGVTVEGEGEGDEMEVDGGNRGQRKRMSDKTPLRRKEKHALRPLEDNGDGEEETAAGLQIGLGTMFQDAVDWLSDDRREEYTEWKEGIMRRLDELEGLHGNGTSGGSVGKRRGTRPVASAA